MGLQPAQEATMVEVPSKADFEWLHDEISRLQSSVAQVATLAAKAQAENRVLALTCAQLVARACASATDPESLFRHMIESMTDSVAEATSGIDQDGPITASMKQIAELVEARASSWLAAYRGPGAAPVN
jgi:hypothetical protein